MTPSSERQILEADVLEAIAASADRLPPKALAAFLAMRGEAYDGRLMIVGRAVNGWRQGITPSDLARPGAVHEFARAVEQESLGDGRCPMRWVTDHWQSGDGKYNTKRSSFWRVVRRVVGDLDIADVERPDWPSHLVWTNLYKVAPFDGGNPDDRLCGLQEKGCLALSRHELATHRPEKILFMTGLSWAAPFLEEGEFDPANRGRFVEASGRLALGDGAASRFVVACHPQTRPDAEWVDEVTKALRARA